MILAIRNYTLHTALLQQPRHTPQTNKHATTPTSHQHTNMERTPSPPRRVHTPPAPMYGDTYEPFSPRRSSRVAAQRDSHLHLHREQTSPRTRRDITPTASSKRSAARANPFALSPPSSPVSPPPQQQQQLRSPRSTRRAPLELNPLDSDSDHAAPTPARRFLAATMAPVSCPTVAHRASARCACPTTRASSPKCCTLCDHNMFLDTNSYAGHAPHSSQDASQAPC